MITKLADALSSGGEKTLTSPRCSVVVELASEASEGKTTEPFRVGDESRLS